MTPELKRILRPLVLDLRHRLEGEYDDNGRWQAGDLETRLAAMALSKMRNSLPYPRMCRIISDYFH